MSGTEQTMELCMGGQKFVLTENDDFCLESIHFRPYYSLPTDMVTGMSRMSYRYPELKQEVLDALSPFQIQSKLWMCSVVRDVLDHEFSADRIAMFGSWFGQQAALLSRQVRGYENIKTYLIDQREIACLAAKFMLDSDEKYTHGSKVEFSRSDALKWEFPGSVQKNSSDNPNFPSVQALRNAVFDQDMIIWNGVEHFDRQEVLAYVRNHPDVAFALQGTDLPDPEHTNKVLSEDDLLSMVPEERHESIVYLGSLRCDFATRYTAVLLPEVLGVR